MDMDGQKVSLVVRGLMNQSEAGLYAIQGLIDAGYAPVKIDLEQAAQHYKAVSAQFLDPEARVQSREWRAVYLILDAIASKLAETDAGRTAIQEIISWFGQPRSDVSSLKIDPSGRGTQRLRELLDKAANDISGSNPVRALNGLPGGETVVGAKEEQPMAG